MWSFLFKQSSATAIGTLFHAKNVMKRVHVGAEPFKDYYASADFVDDTTNAYLVAGAHDHFGFKELSSSPETLSSLPDQDSLLQEARKFVEKHVSLKWPDIGKDAPRSNQHVCIYCGMTFKRIKSLKNHEMSMHNHNPSPFTVSDEDSEDRVYNYTCLFLLLALMRFEHNDAIRMADGDRMMRINRYFTLIYKHSNCPKYAYAMLETAAQDRVLLPKGLSYELRWNRCVNHQGKPDTNFPNDKDVEHMNGYFKQEAHTYRGEFTEKTLMRISRSTGITEQIVTHYKTTAGVRKHAGKHTDIDRGKDVTMLAKHLIDKSVYSVVPGREHRGFEDISRNPLNKMDLSKVKKWIGQSLNGFSYKSYYVKFE